jgi:hypothetical protein
MMRVTFLLLFLPCFFSVTTYADVFLTSPYEPLELSGQGSFPQRPGFYDTSVQPARPQALVGWNPVSKNRIPTVVRHQNLIIRSVKLQVDLDLSLSLKA